MVGVAVPLMLVVVGIGTDRGRGGLSALVGIVHRGWGIPRRWLPRLPRGRGRSRVSDLDVPDLPSLLAFARPPRAAPRGPRRLEQLVARAAWAGCQQRALSRREVAPRREQGRYFVVLHVIFDGAAASLLRRSRPFPFGLEALARLDFHGVRRLLAAACPRVGPRCGSARRGPARGGSSSSRRGGTAAARCGAVPPEAQRAPNGAQRPRRHLPAHGAGRGEVRRRLRILLRVGHVERPRHAGGRLGDDRVGIAAGKGRRVVTAVTTTALRRGMMTPVVKAVFVGLSVGISAATVR
mmetsp:Transcript_30899/g.65768  ORF Transcript_30899/g.65768 Transcript_30899/m.65768 type:complete len:295 (+) Transcript_30899:3087-3971(+)